MKNLILLVALLAFSSCSTFSSSTEQLENAGTCKVWKDALLGLKNEADVVDEVASYKHSCRFWTLWCSYTYAKFKDRGDIYTSNSGLITAEMRAATFDGKKYAVDSSIVKVEPFELANGKAHYTSTVLGATNDVTVHYNKSCSARQAALGVAVLFSK